ncbi:BROMI protein, partial [Acromyrmex heyeri]
MTALLNSMKKAIAEQYVIVKPSSAASQSSHSFASDLAADEWTSPQGNAEEYNCIIDKISRDKPVHVRLAGYEILLKIELSNINNSSQWDLFQKTLLDGLTDDSRAIFDASMQVHARLLNCSLLNHIYSNLLNAFNAQYHSQKLRETLPTLISGINFKFFLHEKLFYIMHLIVRYQEEMLKNTRLSDKTVEEVIEQFIVFLSTHSFGNSLQPKTLNMLNIISVLEPQAKWSKRWLHSLSTRRTFIVILAKSPTFLQNVIECVKSGVAETPCSLSISIMDESNELCIPGNTIETATYLHCLTFVSQLCSYEAGRKLLAESSLKTPFDVADFLIELLNSLNKLAADAPSGVYNTSCNALQNMLDVSDVLYNIDFYHATLCRLASLSENNIKIWPHTLNIISHMIDTVDGPAFLTTNCKEHSINSENTSSKCPVAIIMQCMSNLLKQPFSIMDIKCILSSFNLIEKLFDIYDVYEAAQEQIEMQFYPAVANFYKRINKCSVENENKVQQLDSAVKKVLLKMVSIPLGLQALVNEKLVFEELIRGLIAPLRVIWSSTDIVSFISSAGYFDLGYNVLANLGSHVLSTLLSQTCTNAKDPRFFYDPWDKENVDEFLHILTLFSLNFNCFAAFMVNDSESDNDEEKDYPSNLFELLQAAIDEDSIYHYLALLSLNTVIWNLDVCAYLLNLLNFQEIAAVHLYIIIQFFNSMMTNLLNQMHKAIPTAEWVEQFEWQENITYDTDYWLPEDIHAINIVLNYAEQREILKNNNDSQKNLKQFIHSAYIFIQYNKPNRFEGFDWFLATVFIISINYRCKTFIMQVIQFPSTLLLWPKLGKLIDEKNNEGTSSQFTFMQVLETMVNIELPNIKYGLKDFQTNVLDEYRCHNYITYMDNLGQRYRNRILPAMTKNLNSEDEI